VKLLWVLINVFDDICKPMLVDTVIFRKPSSRSTERSVIYEQERFGVELDLCI
jgi:hypothetical protein